MTDAKVIYIELYNKYSNDPNFDFLSDIYLQEFFMYIAIKSDKKLEKKCLPLLDVQNILSNIVHNNNDLLTDINNFILKYNNNPIIYENIKYFYKEIEIELGQINFINYMNEIFNHNYVSDIIKKIKINVNICGHLIYIEMYNNDIIRDVKEEVSAQLKTNYNILINPNRIALIYKKVILNNINRLDFYNIQNNTHLNSSIIMSSVPCSALDTHASEKYLI
jgi:hypothetical protein